MSKFRVPVVRIVLTIMLIVMLSFALSAYQSFQGGIEAQIALSQLNDSVISYGVAKALITNNTIPKVITIVFVFILFLMWISPVVHGIKYAVGTIEKKK